MDGVPDCVIYFNTSEEICTKRCIERAKTSGRADDTEEIILKRLRTYSEMSKPVVEFYKGKGKVIEIDGGKDQQEVWDTTKNALTAIQQDIVYSQQRESVFSYVLCTPWDIIQTNDTYSYIAMNKILAKKAKNDQKVTPHQLYKPLIVVGPSGVGKGTLITKFTELHKEKFGFSVSYTTRTPREGEKHGVHYYFIQKHDFWTMIEKDEFIEHCEVHGNFYGTSKRQI